MFGASGGTSTMPSGPGGPYVTGSVKPQTPELPRTPRAPASPGLVRAWCGGVPCVEQPSSAIDRIRRRTDMAASPAAARLRGRWSGAGPPAPASLRGDRGRDLLGDLLRHLPDLLARRLQRLPSLG